MREAPSSFGQHEELLQIGKRLRETLLVQTVALRRQEAIVTRADPDAATCAPPCVSTGRFDDGRDGRFSR